MTDLRRTETNRGITAAVFGHRTEHHNRKSVSDGPRRRRLWLLENHTAPRDQEGKLVRKIETHSTTVRTDAKTRRAGSRRRTPQFTDRRIVHCDRWNGSVTQPEHGTGLERRYAHLTGEYDVEDA
ncbi:hypothetical protein [Halostagnicola larsenii]|nr:hypothetical protein [Halostagnicola larsenii]